MKQDATLDSSFWINATAAGLIDALLADFDVRVSPDVSRELPESYPSGAYLHRLIEDRRIVVQGPQVLVLAQFGAGERAAISLAAEHRDWTLLLDDVRPFRSAQTMGLSPVCSPAYAASLYERGALDDGGVLTALARLAVRSTVSPHLLALALRQVGHILGERRRASWEQS